MLMYLQHLESYCEKEQYPDLESRGPKDPHPDQNVMDPENWQYQYNTVLLCVSVQEELSLPPGKDPAAGNSSRNS